MKFSGIITLVAFAIFGPFTLVASPYPFQGQAVQSTQQADSKVTQAIEQDERKQDEEVEVEELPIAINATERLQRAFDSELAWLKMEFDLEDASIEQLRDSLAGELEAAPNRSSQLDDGFQKQVWDALEPMLNDDQQVRLTELRTQAGRLNALIDMYSQKAIVLQLDSILSLTTKQDVALSEVVKSNWNGEWNDKSLQFAFYGMSGIDKIFDQIGREKLRRHLTPEQIKVFKEINSYSLDLHRVVSSGEVIDEAKLTSLCSCLMKLRLAEVSDTCSLEPGQIKRLAIASKGAISKFAARWESTMTGALDRPRVAVRNKDVVDMTMAPVVSQCTAESIWSKTLDSVLNEDQMKLLKVRQESRQTNSKSIVIGYMSLDFLRCMSDVKLRYDRFVALTEMLDRNIDLKDGQMIDASDQCLKVPDEEFKRVLSVDEWAKLSPVVKEQRKQLEKMEKASEDAKEDGDEQ